MQDLTLKAEIKRDLDSLACLLQGYEHYGSVSAPPDCLDRLASVRRARRRGDS